MRILIRIYRAQKQPTRDYGAEKYYSEIRSGNENSLEHFNININLSRQKKELVNLKTGQLRGEGEGGGGGGDVGDDDREGGRGGRENKNQPSLRNLFNTIINTIKQRNICIRSKIRRNNNGYIFPKFD